MPTLTFPDADVFRAGGGEPALRWGLVSPGWIAGEFVRNVHAHTFQRFTAVASRSQDRAEAFAREHSLAAAYASVEELAADRAVDVVYIASPPSEHLPQALVAIAAGKHVMIEKPLTSTAAEAQTLADAARAAGVLLMEAMWSRYLPQASVTRALLADGALGDVHAVMADHGQAISPAPAHRLSQPALGGGALLDLAIYPVQFASMVLGTPTSVTAVGALAASGVDESAALVLRYGGADAAGESGAWSTLNTSMTTRLPNRAVIAGADAHLEFAPYFYNPTTLTLGSNDHGAETATWVDAEGLVGFEALSYEATALARYVGEGRGESPLHTLDETVAILATIDAARQQLEAAAGVAPWSSVGQAR
ncbi:Gfo/Idh/MocA family protein [Frondihabitans australicus]|uniref:Putative dehydrogenase n=1 Tax=Frondihabitans australicus TaxID=386892 RepID=A0A495IBU0_9MICO|nr:Gfo/Idh/MocA family oxidoreductase [Frondihabitans australicus]RKR73457.1 putative dehydrogenase [Frondihabitans australicus]